MTEYRPKNRIEERKAKFLYLKQNYNNLSQKQMAKILGVSPLTIHNYNNLYQLGKLNVEPIPVHIPDELLYSEPAIEKKAKFIYLIENTKLNQAEMADIIGVSRSTIGKYTKLYQEGKLKNINPIRPKNLDPSIDSNADLDPHRQEPEKSTDHKYMKAGVISTGLESASLRDIKNIIVTFMSQLDENSLYDFSITIRRKQNY